MATATSARRWGVAGGAAAALGGLALVNRARALKAARDHPPIGRFVEVDGVRLHVVERGEGPPILLVHGNGTMIEDWIIAGVLDDLARTNRVIAVDRPGSGHSSRPRGTRWTAERQADLLAGVLDQLGADPVIAVGHSYGSLVTAALALNHPERVKAVVLLAGYYYPTARADVMLVAPNAVPVVGDVLRHVTMPLAGLAMTKGFNRMMFGPAEPTGRWKAEFPWAMAMRPSRARAGASDAVHLLTSAVALAPRYGEIAQPVAILAGRGDRIVAPEGQSEKLHAALPNSRLTLLDGVGHMVHHSAPQAVLSAVRTL